MLSSRSKFLLAAVSMLLIIVIAAVLLRITFGENYLGSSILSDIRINIGLMIISMTVSGVIITYPVKYYFLPPCSLRNILYTILLLLFHILVVKLLLNINYNDYIKLSIVAILSILFVEVITFIFLTKTLSENQ